MRPAWFNVFSQGLEILLGNARWLVSEIQEFSLRPFSVALMCRVLLGDGKRHGDLKLQGFKRIAHQRNKGEWWKQVVLGVG